MPLLSRAGARAACTLLRLLSEAREASNLLWTFRFRLVIELWTECDAQVDLSLSWGGCVPLDDAEAVDPGRSILFTRVTELTCGKLTYTIPFMR